VTNLQRLMNVGFMGSQGRMGKEISDLLVVRNITILGLGRADSSVSAKTPAPDLVIDFSSPEGFRESLRLAQKWNCPFLSGTTGLQKSELQPLRKASEKIPVLWAPNMSLGIAVLKKAMMALKGLQGFDFQIEEIHHRHKKDSPSGTALSLQETLSTILETKLPPPVSIRAGGIFGVHQIHAISEHEWLRFEHQALDRKVFAEGAIQAAHWLHRRSQQSNRAGLYTMDDVLNG